MKQSLGLILLQIAGIVLGLFSVFYIAGSLPPEVYAIVGIYAVISSFISVFSNTGFETHAIRNVLAWKAENATDDIKLIITQSLVYRSILASVLVIPMLFYAFYISRSNFDNQYLGLFILMAVTSIFKALNDSAALLLKSFNMYFAAALTSYTVNVFGKLIGLILFFKFGFTIYINFILFLPLIITLPILSLLRKWIDFKNIFSFKMLRENIDRSKSFALSAYISYLFNHLDQFLVSIFMSQEILGSFTVAKSLLNMAKTFIENIFDQIVQELVKYKNEINQLKKKLYKILKLQKLIVVISILFIPLVFINITNIIEIINLQSYQNIKYYFLFIYISQVLHVGMKIYLNLITLFLPARLYFQSTLLRGVALISIFILILNYNPQLIFLHVVLTNIIMLFYGNYHYNKHFIRYIKK